MNSHAAEMLRYVIAGIINTIIGYSAFWVSLRVFGINPQLANATGYAIGLCVAFVLNRFFVFKGVNFSLEAFIRFLIGFLIAFLINQGVLLFLVSGLKFIPEISQIFSMVFYTIAFYLINKYFVWKKYKTPIY